MTQSIQLSLLEHYYPTFLSEPSGETTVLLGTTSPLPKKLRDLSRFTPEHREKLTDAILTDLKRWDAPAEATAMAEKLRRSNSYGVVTGQQAGIVNGPLYTLYKAVGTIRVATMLTEKYPNNEFVPIFWIEGDDHDFDEARTIHLLERSGDLQTLCYDDNDKHRRSVGDRSADASGLQTFLNEVKEVLGETDFTNDLLEVVTSSYSKDATLTDGFARFFYTLFNNTSLVLLSSRNPDVKELSADILAKEAQNPSQLYEAVLSNTEVLRNKGLPTPITPKPGALFIQHEGERLSLDLNGGSYQIRGTESILSHQEVATIAEQAPQQLSPNVMLRPIVQDAILPTAIYLGGPSEVAYLRQLSDAYPLFNLEQPAIAPRPFVTLVEPKVERVLENVELTLQSLFDQSFDAASYFVDNERSDEVQRKIEEGKEQIATAFTKLEVLTKEIDKSLEKALGANKHKAEKELENFGARLRGSLKRRNETEIKRVEGARQLLLPGKSLQERTLNILYYLNKYGLERTRKTLEQIEVMPGTMQVITISK